MSSPRNSPQRLDGAAQEIEVYIYVTRLSYLDILVLDLVIIVYDIPYTHCGIIILHALL